MTPHYCKEEKSSMMISGCCNWCNVKEPDRVVVINDRLAWVTWAFVILVLIGCVASISYFLRLLM
jgi:hypothetical protein